MAVCEACWKEAGELAASRQASHSETYAELIANRPTCPHPKPMTPAPSTLRELVEKWRDRANDALSDSQEAEGKQMFVTAAGRFGEGTELTMCADELAAALRETCEWTDADEPDYWRAACDTDESRLFTFNDGGPVENKFTHCPYCGKPISLRPATDQE